MKKKTCLSKQALEVLKTRELKLQLMVFFELKDVRTVENYILENAPNGPLMNVWVRDLIHDYAPFLKEKDIYRPLKVSEEAALNKTKQELKRRLDKVPKKKIVPRKRKPRDGEEN